jgi:hypothetical protein
MCGTIGCKKFNARKNIFLGKKGGRSGKKADAEADGDLVGPKAKLRA